MAKRLALQASNLTVSVRVRLPAPHMETRKAGVLIRFEPGDVLTGVGVRSPQSPPTHHVELSLTAKPQDVTLVDAGSNPVAQPTLVSACCSRIQRREATLIF